jgi:hypothetical protein
VTVSDYDMCACDYDDWEEYPIVKNKVVTARKEYRCEECRGVIARGDQYKRFDQLCAGYGWETFRVCQPCIDGPVAFIEKNCGCVPWLGVLEHLEEVFAVYQFKHPGVKFRVGRMIVAMRRRRGMVTA